MELAAKRDWKLDALRGLTLLGISLVHFMEKYYAGQFPKSINDSVTPSLLDQIAQGFVGLFISGKFYMIFSFLFGLSFHYLVKTFDIFHIKKFIIRLIVLFGIGWLHHLHYRGDILTIYALLGILLPLFYNFNPKHLLYLGLLFAANIPSLIFRAIDLIFNLNLYGDNFNIPDIELQAYFDTLATGSYVDILRANSREFIGKMAFQVISGRIFITFGMFLLGLWVGKSKSTLESIFTKSLLKKGIGLLLSSIIILVISGLIVNNLGLQQNMKYVMIFLAIPFDLVNFALAIIYLCLFYALTRKIKFQPFLQKISLVGRMGLTTYLMQTAMGTAIFFSWGLGLLPSLGSGTSFLIGLSVFVLQVYFSQIWLTRYTQGPVEKAWRVSTNFISSLGSRP
jgi:uncharacterized protein